MFIVLIFLCLVALRIWILGCRKFARRVFYVFSCHWALKRIINKRANTHAMEHHHYMEDESKDIDIVLKELNQNDISKYEENQNAINVRL